MQRTFTIRILGTDAGGVLSLAREVEGLLLESGATAEASPTATTSSGGGAEALVLVGGGPASEGGSGGTSRGSPALEVALSPEAGSPNALVLDLKGRGVAAAAVEVLLALERMRLVPSSSGASYSEEDERKIAERLEDLGYL